MARGYSRRRDQTRRRIYVISALLIIAVVIVFISGRYPFGREKVVATSTDTGGPMESETILPAAEPEAEPNLLKVGPPTA